MGKHNDKSSIIEYITVNKIKIYEAKEVANNFGKFFANLGKDLADSINTDGIILNEYLSKIDINPKTIYLNPITEIINI